MPPSKIRILHCIETIASGGVEQTRLTLVRGLDKEKYELKIICTWAGGPIADALEQEGVELIPIGSFRHPFEWKKHKKVLQVIKEYRPHIIHGAIFEGMTMAAVGGRFGGVPVVVMEETSEPTFRSKKAIWLQRLLVRFADRIIGISPSVLTYLKEKARLPEYKLVLINNGVNRPNYAPPDKLNDLRASLGMQSDDIVIGSVGRAFNEVKRFSDILEAMHLLKNKKLKFLLLGEGPDMDMLKEKARALDLQDQFLTVGFHADTAPYYGIMDVFCLASSNEGFGLVAAEAMLHRLPVIATSVGGLKDIVVDGETGYLVPPYRPQVLATQIQTLIDHPQTRKSMGEAGYQRAMTHYTAERYVKEVEELYLGLLEEKGVPPKFTS